MENWLVFGGWCVKNLDLLQKISIPTVDSMLIILANNGRPFFQDENWHEQSSKLLRSNDVWHIIRKRRLTASNCGYTICLEE